MLRMLTMKWRMIAIVLDLGEGSMGRTHQRSQSLTRLSLLSEA
uniref:Uncharacterized protein MANES_06G098900 n=1 Tax=Rhizophora mucronata TaxID=61149 RepID=A0A2P2P404_RHIMU